MTATAIVATALNTHAAHPYGLFIDGLDVVKEPATTARYGVAVESVNVTEAGPGGVSSMSFVIDDPFLQVTIDDGAEIRFHDFTRDLPIFLGYLQSTRIRPSFGGQGRMIEVQAFGIESLLDTCIVPNVVFGVNATVDGEGGMLQMLAAYTPLRAFSTPFVSWPSQSPSTEAAPISGTRFRTAFTLTPTNAPVKGLTIRQAFELALVQMGPLTGVALPPIFLTVDMRGGIRMFPWLSTAGTADLPTDYLATPLTITDTAAGATAAEDLSYERDLSPAQLTTAVLQTTSGAWTVGATGNRRREASVSTDGDATAIIANRAGALGRGSFRLGDFTPVDVHPGGPVDITDARMGWTAKRFVISELAKTFHASGRQTWTVSFFDPGDAPAAGRASLARLIRTITRASLN